MFAVTPDLVQERLRVSSNHLMLDLLGRMPEPGEDVTFRGLNLKADKVQGRPIASVLITRAPEENGEGSEVAGV